jgi:hypothetical protein
MPRYKKTVSGSLESVPTTSKRVKVEKLLIDTTVVSHSPEGKAAWYLNNESISALPKRSAILAAIRNAYAAIGAALQGDSEEEVEAHILAMERSHNLLVEDARAVLRSRGKSRENHQPHESLETDEIYDFNEDDLEDENYAALY